MYRKYIYQKYTLFFCIFQANRSPSYGIRNRERDFDRDPILVRCSIALTTYCGSWLSF